VQDTPDLLQRLLAAGFEFVIVGGVAAAVHGSARNTDDLDIAAVFTADNMARLLTALRPLHPRNATRPDLGELDATPEQLARYRNLYLVTDSGRLDVLGEVPPLASVAEVVDAAEPLEFLGATCKVISLDHLITIKESVGRPKDLLVVAELKAIRDRLRNEPRPPRGEH
jgi:predicted nucleotidyltransferase